MRVFNTRPFARWANRERLSDVALCRAVREIETGLVDAALGGGLYKKRIRSATGGKRGGFRVMLAYRSGRRAVFLYGFAKNERADIDRREELALKKLARELLDYSATDIRTATRAGALIELECDEQDP